MRGKIPETDARASTTWRLQPPSANLVLWRKPRNPPSTGTCALDPGVDATATARPELHHGNSPSTLDARVPATKDQAHDHTARLPIHSLQPGVSTAHSSWVQEQAVYTRGEGRAAVLIGVYVDDLIVTGDDPMQI